MTPADEPKNHFVYLVHGIRTYGEWQEEFKAVLQERGLATEYVFYGRFPTWSFLISSQARRDVREKVRIELEGLLVRGKVSVIAHSFGAYLVTNILLWNQHIKLENLILCGAVTDSRWPLNRIRAQILGGLVNHGSRRDKWPSLAELISSRYKATGVVGAAIAASDNYFHNCDHSGFLTTEYLAKFYLPTLEGTTPVREPSPRMSRLNSFLGWAISHKRGLKRLSGTLAATAVVLLGITYGYRPSQLCGFGFFECTVSISRIEYYPPATCRGQDRAYNASWVTVNKYDFHASEYFFNWKIDGSKCEPNDPEVRSKKQCAVEPTVTDNLVPEYKVISRTVAPQLEFPISVKGGYSSYTAEFSTSVAIPPTGIGLISNYKIKDAFIKIIGGNVRDKNAALSRLYLGDDPLCPSAEHHCPCDIYTGNDVRCIGINIPRKVPLTYRFEIENWNEACGTTP